MRFDPSPPQQEKKPPFFFGVEGVVVFAGVAAAAVLGASELVAGAAAAGSGVLGLGRGVSDAVLRVSLASLVSRGEVVAATAAPPAATAVAGTAYPSRAEP